MFCLFAGSRWACVYAKANSKNRSLAWQYHSGLRHWLRRQINRSLMVIPQNFDYFHWSVWMFFNLKHLAMYSSFKLYNIKLKALFRKINWGIFKYDKNTVNLIYKFSLFSDKFSRAAKTCSSSSKLEKRDAFFFKSSSKLRNHSSGRGLKTSSFFR